MATGNRAANAQLQQGITTNRAAAALKRNQLASAGNLGQIKGGGGVVKTRPNNKKNNVEAMTRTFMSEAALLDGKMVIILMPSNVIPMNTNNS